MDYSVDYIGLYMIAGYVAAKSVVAAVEFAVPYWFATGKLLPRRW